MNKKISLSRKAQYGIMLLGFGAGVIHLTKMFVFFVCLFVRNMNISIFSPGWGRQRRIASRLGD
jgi:4-amino-4-deoxy-L-arabinose transferase-like glycosyltransferase